MFDSHHHFGRSLAGLLVHSSISLEMNRALANDGVSEKCAVELRWRLQLCAFSFCSYCLATMTLNDVVMDSSRGTRDYGTRYKFSTNRLHFHVTQVVILQELHVNSPYGFNTTSYCSDVTKYGLNRARPY
jgi:hypothetical protein